MTFTFLVALWAVFFPWVTPIVAYSQAPKSNQPSSVLATTPAARYFSQKAMCERDASVISELVNATQDPHDFSLTPSHRMKLEEAAIVIWVGPNYEEFLNPILKSKGKEKVWISLLDSITLVPRVELESDPHFWLNPDLALEAVQKLQTKLIQHQVLDAAQATRCFQKFQKMVSTQSDALRKSWSKAVKGPVSFATVHAGYHHFAAAFGVQILPLFGGQHHVHLSPSLLREKVKWVRNTGVKFVFLDPETPPKIQTVVTKDLGLKVAGKLKSDSWSAQSGGNLDPLVEMWQSNVAQVIKSPLVIK